MGCGPNTANPISALRLSISRFSWGFGGFSVTMPPSLVGGHIRVFVGRISCVGSLQKAVRCTESLAGNKMVGIGGIPKDESRNLLDWGWGKAEAGAAADEQCRQARDGAVP
jgi:hypothetical protein